jgi:hypothetical protein
VSESSVAAEPCQAIGASRQQFEAYTTREVTLPLQRAYEHALLVLSGDCALEGRRLEDRVLYYLGTQRSEMCVTSQAGARVLLIGGAPFPQTILMWWNFVARTLDEIREARTDWEAHRRFGEVPLPTKVRAFRRRRQCGWHSRTRSVEARRRHERRHRRAAGDKIEPQAAETPAAPAPGGGFGDAGRIISSNWRLTPEFDECAMGSPTGVCRRFAPCRRWSRGQHRAPPVRARHHGRS